MSTFETLIHWPIVPFLFSCFWAILFLQSGLDKCKDWKGNLDWLTGHFSKSVFAGKVGLLLTLLTITECLAGLFSLVGAVTILLNSNFSLSFVGVCLSGIALLMLFLGQRLAKDYPGAASLVPYFLAAMFNLWLLGSLN